MRIVADQNIPYVVEAFSNVGEITALPTPQITNAVARRAEVLVIRNETPVNEELLRDTPVRFVASATAGTDHVDFKYLAAKKIGFANAPGCNANSVKEFFLAALLWFAVGKGICLRGKTLGVIGVGAIGSKVAAVGKTLGMKVLLNDPPLQRATGDPKFLPLEQVLTADFVTLHTPLTTIGPDATYHLFNEARFASMKSSAVLINTARGAVVETAALNRALREGKIADALIDVWEDEPAIDAEVAQRCALATAHVAGYSMEGKLAAVSMVRQAVCGFFGATTGWDFSVHLPALSNREIRPTSTSDLPEVVLHEIVRRAYDVDGDDRRLRDALSLPPEQRVAGYTKLRTGYPSRREFSSYTIHLTADQEHVRSIISALNFDYAPAQKGISTG